MVLILIGTSWFLHWLLVTVFEMEQSKASLSTAVVFMLLGFVVFLAEGFPKLNRRP